MPKTPIKLRTRSQESSNSIERLYISMRHLFSRGYYKPMGVSGETLRNSLLQLRPEIYGTIGGDQVELNGLVYVLDRLPAGIEECRYINLTSDEGYKDSTFEVIIPKKRRRNCYRIDSNQMNIEITRGRSEIYDILTHLTFLFIESHTIRSRVWLQKDNQILYEWKQLEQIVINNKQLDDTEREVLLVHLSSILGRSYIEVKKAFKEFAEKDNPDRFAQVIYWLGKLAINEIQDETQKRTIKFTPDLRDSIGHHIYGDIWADEIKKTLDKHNLFDRPIHIISANMHSVMNTLYADLALPKLVDSKDSFHLYHLLSENDNAKYRKEVKEYAATNGLIYIKDTSGTNINVQIIDTQKIDIKKWGFDASQNEKPVLIVMDYAFGEQAYETMDELLKPYNKNGINKLMPVESISIMGKAGILNGHKGDIMIPTAHIFEGTADNYPFKNQLRKRDFIDTGIPVIKGTMISVLGTSLQNKDILKFFHNSTWRVIGLEMEGAHYQKAIQAASKIRGTISRSVKVSYAYYASDNPLMTGSTLASGGLGTKGVKPTYTITKKILNKIFTQKNQ
jgi:hypothetical protein